MSLNCCSLGAANDAEDFWKLYYLPRCTRDVISEKAYVDKIHEHKIKFRKVLPDESNRGSPYPLLSALDLNLLAHFGEGVGIYFVQIITLFLFTCIGAFVLIPAMLAYKGQNKEPYDSAYSFFQISAVCNDREVITTSGDKARYRDECTLLPTVVICDIVLCWILVLCVILSKYVEDAMKAVLDDELLSAKDYSIRVLNPPPDAIDPDEWFTFFSRFGKVSYVTVAKSNNNILELIMKKQRYLERIETLGKVHSNYQHHQIVNPYEHDDKKWLFKIVSKLPCQHILLYIFNLSRQHFIEYWKNLIAGIDKELEALYDGKYSVNQVFVTFEHMEHKQLALHKIPSNSNYWMKRATDIFNYFFGNTHSETKIYFRNEYDLLVKEPPEPDNILWINGGVPDFERLIRKLVVFCVSIGVFILAYCLIYWTTTYSDDSDLLLAVVTAIDIFAPNLFLDLTVQEKHRDEGALQAAYQGKLYRVRLLTTAVYLYITVRWDDYLSSAWVSHFVYYQIITCFSDHFIKIFNPTPLVQRILILFDVDPSKSEFRVSNAGTNAWNLAERYTIISKIFFVSLFYSFMIPVAFIIAIFAILFVFLADQYLLFRKSEQPPMLDSKISIRAREQIIFSVAAHMYVTCRFVYGWPLDGAQYDSSTNSFQKVDKYPMYNILKLQPQSWHDDSHSFYFRLYRNMTVIIISICIALYFLGAQRIFKRSILSYFNTEKLNLSVPFSKVARIFSYFPTVVIGSQTYLFSEPENCPVIITDVEGVHSHSDTDLEDATSTTNNCRLEHCYPLVIGRSRKYPNLGELIPRDVRPLVLSRVKYYNVIGTDSSIPSNVSTNARGYKSKKIVAFKEKESKKIEKRKENLDSKIILRPIENDKAKHKENEVNKPIRAQESQDIDQIELTKNLASHAVKENKQALALNQYLEKFRGNLLEENKEEESRYGGTATGARKGGHTRVTGDSSRGHKKGLGSSRGLNTSKVFSASM